MHDWSKLRVLKVKLEIKEENSSGLPVENWGRVAHGSVPNRSLATLIDPVQSVGLVLELLAEQLSHVHQTIGMSVAALKSKIRNKLQPFQYTVKMSTCGTVSQYCDSRRPLSAFLFAQAGTFFRGFSSSSVSSPLDKSSRP